jgi:Tfp pilus assembly protein PilP
VSYEARGRRDPFESPESREESGGRGPTVASAKLTGIVRGAQATLALVETTDGIGYILKPGDTLGDGRLVEIGADSVVFTIVPKPGSTTNRVTLKLAAN